MHSTFCYRNKGPYVANLVTCKISVRVVTPEEMRSIPSGSLSVNGEPITTIKSSVRSTYNTREGEPIIFLCNTTTGGYVEISYTKQDKTSLSTNLQPTQPVQWYMKMTAAYNHDTSLTCNIFDRDRKLTNSIQLDFTVDEHPETTKGFLSFTVNGLLLPYTKRGSREYFHEYKFYKTEQLTIGIVYDQRTQFDAESCEVNGPNPPYNLTKDKLHKGILDSPVSITLEQGGTETSLKCTVTSPVFRSNGTSTNVTPKNIYILHIIFLYQGPDYTPFIGGLLRKNILMKYSNGTSNIIHYEYDNNALDNLRCYGDDEQGVIPTRWKHNFEHFRMNENIKSTVMECKSNSSDSVTYLEIIRVKPAALDTSTTLSPLVVVPSGIPPVLTSSIPTSQIIQESINSSNKNQPRQNKEPTNTHNGRKPNSSTKTTQKPYKPKAHSYTTPITSQGMSWTKPNFVITPTSPRNIPYSSTDPPLGPITAPETTPQHNRYIFVVAGVLVAVIIFISVLCALYLAIKKRKRRLNQMDVTDINYQNLPQHSEGPMPMPAQWDSQNDQAVYDNVTNLQDLYSKPIPKNQRSQRKKDVHVEPTYAQVLDANTCEPTYASVYKDEPAYAEAGKNELAYAEIGKNETAYAHVGKYEPTYAEAGEGDKYQNFGQLKGLANQLAYVNVAENNSERLARPLSSRNQNYTENTGCEQNYANAQELKRETETEYANLNNNKAKKL